MLDYRKLQGSAAAVSQGWAAAVSQGWPAAVSQGWTAAVFAFDRCPEVVGLEHYRWLTASCTNYYFLE
jgi:hypothetical protein